MIRRKRVFEEKNGNRHEDWAIDDVKQDLENLLKIHQSIKPHQFNEKNIRDIVKNLRDLIAYLHSAYRIESEVVTDSDRLSKNQMDEAEDEILRAKIKAENLVNLLSVFDHNFHLNA